MTGDFVSVSNSRWPTQLRKEAHKLSTEWERWYFFFSIRFKEECISL